VLLDAGSALGRNCGPLLISKREISRDEVARGDLKIAIPGKYTTANFLLSLAFPRATDKSQLLFSEIEGAVLDGEKLTDDARSLKFVEGQPVVSIADAETRKTAIAGYFLIRARDYQEAIAIAESCPHAKYGGTIEIRQIDSVTRKTN